MKPRRRNGTFRTVCEPRVSREIGSKQSIPKELRYTFEHFNREFPDDHTCLEYIKKQRLPDGMATCEKCAKETRHHRVPYRILLPVLWHANLFACRNRMAKTVETVGSSTPLGVVREHVLPARTIYSDEHRGHQHKRIHHSSKVYAMGDIHTNSVEGFCGLIKRRIGLYHAHHVSGSI